LKAILKRNECELSFHSQIN